MDTVSPKPALGPLVSICTLINNREHYLNATIDSVIAQTYSNWELIIIDGSSTDDIEEMIRSYNDERIKYTKLEADLLTRRKKSLTQARGHHIAVLDSGDYWKSPKKLKRQVAFLESHPECAVIGTFVTFVDTLDEKISSKTFPIKDNKIRKNMLLCNQFSHSSVLMRKSMIDKTHGYQIPLVEDWDLFLQLGTVGTFANIPEYLTCRRVHDENSIQSEIVVAHTIHTLIHTYRYVYPRFYIALVRNYWRFLRGYFEI